MIYALITLVTLIILAYPAAMQGAGPYHFMPLLPVLVEARRRLPTQGIGARNAPFLTLIFASFAMQGSLNNMAFKQGWSVVAGEALALARGSPVRPVHVGYGESFSSYGISQLAKTVLALNFYQARIDAQILMEQRAIGIDASTRWIPDLTRCHIKRWLLPKGEKPFATVSLYDGGALFSEEFRSVFFAHY
jgi:hypothetical protein